MGAQGYIYVAAKLCYVLSADWDSNLKCIYYTCTYVAIAHACTVVFITHTMAHKYIYIYIYIRSIITMHAYNHTFVFATHNGKRITITITIAYTNAPINYRTQSRTQNTTRVLVNGHPWTTFKIAKKAMWLGRSAGESVSMSAATPLSPRSGVREPRPQNKCAHMLYVYVTCVCCMCMCMCCRSMQ